MSVPSGGPATINGIIYQMLWSLLRASRMRILDPIVSPDGIKAESARLILEPIGGGGDAITFSNGIETVVQLKAKSCGGTWSLRAIVAEVLPDLYRGVRAGSLQQFRFVTEGRVGEWKEVAKFFRSLASRPIPAVGQDILGALDDVGQVAFAGSLAALIGKPGSEAGSPMSERTLFKEITNRLRERPPVSNESDDVVLRNLWKLLANFEVVESQTSLALRSAIEERLLPVVRAREQLNVTIQGLLMDLAERASHGDAEIAADELYAKHGLSAVPLNELNRLISRGSDALAASLSPLGYCLEDDVRGAPSPTDLADWRAGRRKFLILTGLSGQGKTWRLAALAHEESKRSPVIVFPATASAHDDFEQAEKLFSAVIWGQDIVLALHSVADRFRNLLPEAGGTWLTVFIDDVQSYDHVLKLLQQPWPDGIRAAITAPLDVAEQIRAQFEPRVLVLDTPDFTDEEAEQYCVGGDPGFWHGIPADVRGFIRRPLLARLFRDLATTGWKPTNEYDLVDNYYRKYYETPIMRTRPAAVGALGRATLAVWHGAPYPWSFDDLAGYGLGEDALRDLLGGGWLRALDGRKCRLWHDRLLAWEIARALAEMVQNGIEHERDLKLCARACFTDHWHPQGASGYVAMDLAWRLSRGDQNTGILNQLLAELESASGPAWHRVSIYETLVATAGEQMVPAIARRIEENAGEFSGPIRQDMALAIAKFDGEHVTEAAIRLLNNPDYGVRRAGIEILTARPSAKAMDPLLRLYLQNRGSSDLASKSGQEIWDRFRLEKALRTAAPLDAMWVENQLSTSEKGQAALGFVASLLEVLPNGQECWHRLKPVLRECLGPGDRWAFASNIGRWRDRDEINWLRTGIKEGNDSFFSSTCLQALTRIDPDLAIEVLKDVTAHELADSHHRTVDRMTVAAPEALAARVAELYQSSGEDRWQIAGAYGAVPEALPGSVFQALLEDINSFLSVQDLDSLYTQLKIIAKVNSLRLLGFFWERAGSSMENTLADQLHARGGRQNVYSDIFAEPAIEVLNKVGGNGLTRLINACLTSGAQYGMYDCLSIAHKRPNEETVQLLRLIATTPSPPPPRLPLANTAGQALALIGDWEGVVAHIVENVDTVDRRTLYSRPGASPLSDEIMKPVFDTLGSDPFHRGALVATGFAGRTEFGPQIVWTLANAGSNDALINSCLWAIHLLAQLPPTAVPIVARYLGTPHGWIALPILRNDESDASLNSLLAHFCLQAERPVPSTFPMGDPEELARLGRFLLERAQTADRAAAICGQLIDREPALAPYTAAFVRTLGSNISNPTIRQVLDRPVVRQFLIEEAFRQDGNFRLVGNKARSIQMLGELDCTRGYAAALRVLRSPTAHDREEMPGVMLCLDEPRAAADLFAEAMLAELPMKVAIARALRNHGALDAVIAWLGSAVAVERRTSCFLLGFADQKEVVLASIREKLRDPDPSVEESAVKSVLRIEESRRADELVQAFLHETDPARRWILLDAAIEVGEPGGESDEAPKWYLQLLEKEPPATWTYAANRLKTSRKKRLDEIKNAAQEEERGW